MCECGGGGGDPGVRAVGGAGAGRDRMQNVLGWRMESRDLRLWELQ